MARFTQYPAASTGDYAEATTFLIANEDGEIKQASLDGLRSNFGCDIRCASLLIPSAQVLQLNTTPQTIVPAQGVGTVIEVISAVMNFTWASVAYATNTNLIIQTSTGSDKQASTDISLTANALSSFDPEFSSPEATQLVENQDVEVTVDGGNPTAGDSDITIYVTYRVINV